MSRNIGNLMNSNISMTLWITHQGSDIPAVFLSNFQRGQPRCDVPFPNADLSIPKLENRSYLGTRLRKARLTDNDQSYNTDC